MLTSRQLLAGNCDGHVLLASWKDLQAGKLKQGGIMQGMDPYEFAEPVNVLGQLGKDFWDGLAASKWTERRDALQKLRGLAGTPKILPGDFGDVLRELKKIITKDSNVVCVGEAVGCLGNLASGLRSSFVGPAKVGCVMAFHHWHNTIAVLVLLQLQDWFEWVRETTSADLLRVFHLLCCLEGSRC